MLPDHHPEYEPQRLAPVSLFVRGDAGHVVKEKNGWQLSMQKKGHDYLCTRHQGVLQIGSGAVTICARPAAVSLTASHFEGPGLLHCIAGERAEFIIQVCA